MTTPIARLLAQMDATVSALHATLMALYDTSPDMQPDQCMAFVAVRRKGPHARTDVRRRAAYTDAIPKGVSAHTGLRAATLRAEAATLHTVLERHMVRLSGLMARSPACQNHKVWPVILVRVNPQGAFTTHPLFHMAYLGIDEALAARRGDFLRYERGILHRGCTLLLGITALKMGPTWALTLLDSGQAGGQDTQCVQAPTQEDAQAWAALIHWPDLLIGRGKIGQIAEVVPYGHDQACDFWQGLFTNVPMPAFTPLPHNCRDLRDDPIPF